MIDAQNPLRKGKPFTDIMLSKGRIQKIESAKELSLCNKSKFSNTYIYTTKFCKPLIFQALIVLFNRSHSLKYLWSTTLL